MSGQLLIIDDEPIAVKNLAYALTKNGYEVQTRASGPGGLEALENRRFDLVLTDMRMERVDGHAILNRAIELDPDIAVIMITAHGTLASAVEAMKRGAFHYIAKPFRIDEVRGIVENALEFVRLKRENRLLREQVAAGDSKISLITQDSGMQRLLAMARQIAPTGANVIISGETGTGKELLARYIHNHSSQLDGPFVAINCGALQEELLANELFGHEKGAYSGATEQHTGVIEAAHGGTLFLDEIGEMPLSMQVKLLRVIQEGEVQRLGSSRVVTVKVRWIAATHRELRDEVAADRFRHDLFFRLDVVGMKLPPLSLRKDDIPLLAFYFLRKHALRMGRRVNDIAPETLVLLLDYDYPGNIRELENIIERGVALARGETLTVAELPETLTERAVRVVREADGRLPTLNEREVEYILYVLKHCQGNRTIAAQILGIDRVSLWRKINKYNINDDKQAVHGQEKP